MVVTAGAVPDVARAYNNHVNSYLVKPVSLNDFLTVVQQVGEYWLSLNIGPPKGD